MNLIVLIFILILMILAVFVVAYLLWRLINLDATARNIAHPKLLSFLVAGTQNGIGLFTYLALRRGHDIQAPLDNPKLREKLKISVLLSYVLLMLLTICLLVIILKY